MYLLCAPQNRIESYTKLFNQVDIAITPLALTRLVANETNLAWLDKNINLYNYIIFSSPSAIKLCIAAIKLAKDVKFIVVGRASCKILKKYTQQDIYFPTNPGSIDLVKEVLPQLKMDNTLVIKGDSNNNTIELYLSKQNKNFKILSLYSIIKLSNNKKKLNLANMQGIIITSSSLVYDLLLYMDAKNMIFYTFHAKIASTLEKFGIKKIVISNEANMTSLVQLISRGNVQ